MRVACPAQGTTILSKRLDIFLNGLLLAIGSVVGGKLNPVYQVIKELLTGIIGQKTNPEIMPGLWAMVPKEPIVKMLNNPREVVPSELYVIEGDADIGGSFKRMALVVLTNLFYMKSNDYVVDTRSMTRGVSRKNGLHAFLSKNSETHHLNYFSKAYTQNAVFTALCKTDSAWEKFRHIPRQVEEDSDRGVILRLANFEGLEWEQTIDGSKPIAIVIPGIMGSALRNGDHHVWIGMDELFKGGMKKYLSIDADNVHASGVLKKYYEKLVRHLSKTHQVLTFSFDWRKDIAKEAEKLAGKIREFQTAFPQTPLHVVAHSMGGLLARQVWMDNPDIWEKFKQNDSSRFLMLGTPWLGSYLIMEVLTGHSKRVKQLALVDIKHNKKELLKIFVKYPGIYQLLPIDNREFESAAFWNEVQKHAGSKMTVPTQRMRTFFKKYKAKVEAFDRKETFENTYYIAGKKDSTVCDYEFTENWFGKSDIEYKKTAAGDGSVTWESGIPVNLDPERVYYTQTDHTNLPNDPDLFGGILDILFKGGTNKLSLTKPVVRSTGNHVVNDEIVFYGLSDEDIFRNIFDEAESDKLPHESSNFEVTVTNASLRAASYPVVAGHFKDDGIIGAEKVIDELVNYELSERERAGVYPYEIGDNLIIINSAEKLFKGAAIVGIGDSEKLNVYRLAQTIEKMVLNYALHHSCDDDESIKNGLSFLLVGSNFGQIKISDSVKAILVGTSRANTTIRKLEGNAKEITKIEFIELYEEKAAMAYSALKKLEREDQRYRLKLQGKLNVGYNAKKISPFKEDESWWIKFGTKAREKEGVNDGFTYESSNGLARVELEDVAIPLKEFDRLVRKMAQSSRWDMRLSKVLMEIMMPNNFKGLIRNQHNIHWKVDEVSAAIPWEMFHDTDYDTEPTFTRAGLIRQLYTPNYLTNIKRAPSKIALVVGNPDYSNTDLSSLPAAQVEAESVQNILESSNIGFNVTYSVNEQGDEILAKLYETKYKILHFAAHGVYDPEKGEVGIVIGKDQILSPALFNQLSYVPDFVFINCCYSGSMQDSKEYTESRNNLAANIGTQLIRMGVKAIVVAGWAVNDSAAKAFADKLYQELMNGVNFGDAVKTARNHCYMAFDYTNTWGAYQCYGDPFFSMSNTRAYKPNLEDYYLPSHVAIELDNLLTNAKRREHMKWVKSDLKRLMNNVKQNNLLTAEITEKEATIYGELGYYDKAIAQFQSLFSVEKANFSVRSIEQYCNYRAKAMVKNQEFSQEILEEIEQKLNALIGLGATSGRYALLGSFYKRTAQITEPDTRKKLIQDMEAAYWESYKLLDPDDLQRIVYPITNYAMALVIQKQMDPKFNLNQAFKKMMKVNPIDYFTHLQDELKSHTKKSFWDEVTLINIDIVLVLFPDSEAHRKEDDIIENYKQIFKSKGSIKDIIGEREQLDFMLEIMKDALTEEQTTYLSKIRSFLQEIAQKREESLKN